MNVNTFFFWDLDEYHAQGNKEAIPLIHIPKKLQNVLLDEEHLYLRTKNFY